MQQWLAAEEERKKPEFLKQRPKYFYYYEWMKERISTNYPALPESVMDKLLTMPAGDLDLILQHPKATTWKVGHALLSVCNFAVGWAADTGCTAFELVMDKLSSMLAGDLDLI